MSIQYYFSALCIHIDGTHPNLVRALRRRARMARLADRLQRALYPRLVSDGELQRLFVHAAAKARREQRKLAVLSLTIGNLDELEDDIRAGGGAELLCGVALRLADCVRTSDAISAQGSRRFTVLLRDLPNARAARAAALRIQHAFAESIDFAGHTINVSLCIGASIWPDDGKDKGTLLRRANTARRHARESQSAVPQFFAEGMAADAVARKHLQAQLYKAIQNEEFILHYQPQFDIQGRRIIGVEALVRWSSPDAGLIDPDTFIALAERTGLVVPIGKWVLEQACKDAKHWQDLGLPPVNVAVNLSALQFETDTIVDTVTGALDAAQLTARRLELELTESVLLGVSDAALRRLREIGVRLAIDHFGTGYSNLAYLKRFQFDTVKIDRTFLRDIETDPERGLIVKSIIDLGHALRLGVIAEGVETAGELACLAKLGCKEIQGYLFSRPLPSHEFERLLREADSAKDREHAVPFVLRAAQRGQLRS